MLRISCPEAAARRPGARLRRAPLLLLLPLLVGCSGGAAITVNLQLGSPDPFQGVATVRLEANGPAPMQSVQAEAPRGSSEVTLPPIPFGSSRRIVVEGLDGQRFILSRGESALFDVSAEGPDEVSVAFARCTDDLSRDEDGDGYGAGPTRQSCAQAGWAAQSGDCDDRDADAHPGQTEFFTHPSRGTGGFDFNCDGVEQPEFAATTLPDCAVATPCKGDGWTSVPACGGSGSYGSCTKQGAQGCIATVQPTVQGCR